MMKIKKIAAVAMGVVGTIAITGIIGCGGPTPGTVPIYDPGTAAFAPDPTTTTAAPDPTTPTPSINCYMTVNEGYQLTIEVTGTSDCAKDASIVQSTLDDASPGDTVTPNTGPPPAGAQPICSGPISIFGESNDNGQAYSEYPYALEPVCADMAWT